MLLFPSNMQFIDGMVDALMQGDAGRCREMQGRD
jgi:hypothetical protein